MRTTRIVVYRGEVRVSAKTATIVVEHEDIALLEVDLDSKYAKAGIYSQSSPPDCAPFIFVTASERTLEIDDKYSGMADTLIEFPERLRWGVRMAEVTRYTLSVLLMRDAGGEGGEGTPHEQ